MEMYRKLLWVFSTGTESLSTSWGWYRRHYGPLAVVPGYRLQYCRDSSSAVPSLLQSAPGHQCRLLWLYKNLSGCVCVTSEEGGTLAGLLGGTGDKALPLGSVCFALSFSVAPRPRQTSSSTGQRHQHFFLLFYPSGNKRGLLFIVARLWN